MKVYVDEMPKNCNDCQFLVFVAYHQNGFLHRERYCPLRKDGNCNCSKENCPLQSLVEHDQQVEKNLIDKMENLAGDYWSQPYVDEDTIMTGDDFAELLKQLEKGDADNGKTIQG